MPELKNDFKLYVATGKSRKETHWKNKEWLWSDLVERLSNTHYTAETHEEYMAASKGRQDEIKDVGGFVGGYLTKGKRNKGSVLSRQIITLDADNNPKTLWDDFSMLYDCAAMCYSTHKHTPDNPRLRLVIPMNREVTPDEYEAISRKVAGTLGIELFDPSTFQAWRLMYWPSTSKGAEYFCETQEGAAIDADKVLNSYKNWKDSSEWPVSAKHQEIITREIKKQGDPLEKPGVVGAFCRSYTVHEVIEKYLGEVYDLCDGEDNRYTYKGGSTSSGMVVYDDKFAYSHHGTDPAGGKLCNGFDLVRIHLFGLADEDTDKRGFQLPSYQAMLDLATKDKNVRKLLGEEKIKEAFGDFEEALEPGEDENTSWMSELDIDRKGNLLPTITNVQIILRNDPKLKGRIAFNEFECSTDVLKPFPWDVRRLTYPRPWGDKPDDMAMLRNYIGSAPYDIKGKGLIEDVVEWIKNENRYHPVRDYLDNLEWDGEERIDTLFIDYLGVEDSEYTRAVSRKTLCAAVARIYRPGCKFDYTLTLVGDEGEGKSTIYKKLGMQWHSGSFNYAMIKQGVRALEQLQGVWIMEAPEMSGLDATTLEMVKGFLTNQDDRARWAYGRDPSKRERQSIFVANSNNFHFLIGGKGLRRWWALHTNADMATKEVHTMKQRDIDQLWAEAVVKYREGEKLYLSKELEAQARAKQQEHTETDDREGLIHEYLSMLLPENWEDMDTYERREFIHGNDPLQPKGTVQRTRVTAAEIWCEALGGYQKEMTAYNTKFIHRIMESAEGWDRSKSSVRMKNYGFQKGYVKTKKISLKTQYK